MMDNARQAAEAFSVFMEDFCNRVGCEFHLAKKSYINES